MIEMSSVWHDAVHSLNQSIAIIAPDGTLQLVNQSWATQASRHGLSPDWDRPGINLLHVFAANRHNSTLSYNISYKTLITYCMEIILTSKQNSTGTYLKENPGF
ncbi:hypothetical protein [Paenibacillus sp. FSL K6-2524]|uniref:hypothetical protein n=1 Tax=Paenibacillus sp. FSL K6-2524 TaxID=2954516 RepID=UPI0030FB97B9